MPLIGTIYSHGFAITEQQLTAYAKQYGNMFSLQFGPRHCIVVSGHELINDVISRPDDFGQKGLYEEYVWGLINPSQKGIISLDYGDEYRRTCDKIRAAFLPIGDVIVSEQVSAEMSTLCNDMRSSVEKRLNPREQIDSFVMNVLLRGLVGTSLALESTEMTKLKQSTGDFHSMFAATSVIDCVPLVHYVPSMKRRLLNFVYSFLNTKAFMESQVSNALENEHAALGNCFLQNYLNNPAKSMRRVRLIDTDELIHLLTDLLIEQTHVRQLVWKLLEYLAQDRDIQEKLFTDIQAISSTHDGDDVITHLPYLQAVTAEAARLFDKPLMTFQKSNPKDVVKLGNMTIAKGTRLILNNDSVNSSADAWKDPRVFKPERFLNKNGQFKGCGKMLSFQLDSATLPWHSTTWIQLCLMVFHLIRSFKFEENNETTESIFTIKIR